MTDFLKEAGVYEAPIFAGNEIVDPTVDISNGEAFYGFQPKGYGRPEQLAPRDDNAGGFLFLPNNIQPEFVDGLVALAGLASNEHVRKNKYGVQMLEAGEGMEAELGYLRKLVVADKFALEYLFKCKPEPGRSLAPEQPLDVAELIKAFFTDERRRHGTFFGGSSLAGKFGGDGHFAQESLSFGFAIENHYYRVISVWSRAWLVTK